MLLCGFETMKLFRRVLRLLLGNTSRGEENNDCDTGMFKVQVFRKWNEV